MMHSDDDPLMDHSMNDFDLGMDAEQDDDRHFVHALDAHPPPHPGPGQVPLMATVVGAGGFDGGAGDHPHDAGFLRAFASLGDDAPLPTAQPSKRRRKSATGEKPAGAKAPGAKRGPKPKPPSADGETKAKTPERKRRAPKEKPADGDDGTGSVSTGAKKSPKAGSKAAKASSVSFRLKTPRKRSPAPAAAAAPVVAAPADAGAAASPVPAPIATKRHISDGTLIRAENIAGSTPLVTVVLPVMVRTAETAIKLCGGPQAMVPVLQPDESTASAAVAATMTGDADVPAEAKVVTEDGAPGANAGRAAGTDDAGEGDGEEAAATITEPIARLAIRLRPDDPWSHPVQLSKTPDHSLLVKVIRRKERPGVLPSQPVSIEPVGWVRSRFVPDSLADFQFLAPASQSVPLSANTMLDLITQVHKMSLNKEATLPPVPRVVIPAIFAKVDKPQPFSLRKRNETKAVMENLKCVRFDYDKLDEPVPGIPAEPAPIPNSTQYVYKEVLSLYQQRPMWTMTELQDLLQSQKKLEHSSHLKVMLPLISYFVTRGPFRGSWVAYGYDPRQHPETVAWQTVDLRLRLHTAAVRVARAAAYAAAARGIKNTGDGSDLPEEEQLARLAYVVFMPRLGRQSRLFRLMDIQRTGILSTVRSDYPTATYLKKTGWMTEGDAKRIRDRLVECCTRLILLHNHSVLPTASQVLPSELSVTSRLAPAAFPRLQPAFGYPATDDHDHASVVDEPMLPPTAAIAVPEPVVAASSAPPMAVEPALPELQPAAPIAVAPPPPAAAAAAPAPPPSSKAASKGPQLPESWKAVDKFNIFQEADDDIEEEDGLDDDGEDDDGGGLPSSSSSESGLDDDDDDEM